MAVPSLCWLTYAVQMLFHEVSYTTLDNSLLFLLAGIAVGLGSASKRPETAESTSHHEVPVACPV